MRRLRKVSALTVSACVAADALAGCAQPRSSEAEVLTTSRTSTTGQDSPTTPAPTPVGLTLIYPTWGVGADSLEELLTNEVTFIGTVTAAEGGPELVVDEPGARDQERCRLVTIHVDTVLAGDAEIESVTLYTFGWAIGSGHRTPITPEGVPWLDVGEQVFVSASHAEEGDLQNIYAPTADDGTFEVIDGRIAEPYGGSSSGVWAEIGGLTVEELTTRIRDIN